MQKILGIGGFFFRAKDTQGLAKWYADNFGILDVPQCYDAPAWRTNGGTTVFSPFAHDTAYFRDDTKQWMINFRVADLGAMAEQLRANGIDVEIDKTEYPNGFFAFLTDPEGNPIQLWQPIGAALDDEETT